MKTLHLLAAAALLGATTLSIAQPGPGRGPGAGPGAGPCAAASGASGVPADCPRGGMGPGMGMRRGGAHWGRDYTPGWSMMSADERTTHRQQMMGFKTYEECKAYMDKHHDDMVARAKERGITMPAAPRRDACAGLKAPAK